MFMNDISIIERQTRVFTERHMAHANVGFPEQRILMYLTGNAPSNQERIARSFGIDKGSITKSVAKLEEKGLIVRTINPENKREKTIELSKRGESILDDMKAVYREWDEKMYRGITEEDKQALHRVLGKMARNAEGIMEERHGE